MKLRSWLVVVLACVLVTGGLGYYKYRQIQAAIAFGKSFPEPVLSVELFLAREEVWQPTTQVTGEAVARQTVRLSSELAGRIVEVGFEPGSAVKHNQVLLRLDTSEERAQLAAAQADAELARLELNRNQKLIASGAASEEARDRARAGFDGAMASVNRLLAIIDKKTLRAPFDGTASLHELETGQYLDRGAEVVRLIGLNDRIWVDFALPQQQARLDVGGHVTVSAGDREVSAEVIARDAFVNELSRNVRFRAEVDNVDSALVPGSLVTVEVPVGELQNVVLVPATAVRRADFGASVYVLRPSEEGARAPERAERRDVTLGPQRQGLIIVTSGLGPGERVAANGAFKLRDGVLVNAVPVNETTAGAAGAAAGGA